MNARPKVEPAADPDATAVDERNPWLGLASFTEEHGDRWQNVELAAALYAQALTDRTRRTVLLQKAGATLDVLPSTMRCLHDIRQWRERILAAERGA